jgi:cytochrome c oxidase subunit 2
VHAAKGFLVAIVALGTLPAMARAQPAGAPAAGTGRASAQQVHTIEINAERFVFVPNHIEVTQGERVRLVLRSRDVSHGFAIKELGIDEELPHGGDAVTVEFVASTPGRYQFACTIYCGLGHNGMTGTLTVLPASGGGTAPQAPQEAYPGQFEDLSLDLAQPDFTLVTLPTTLRVPRYRSAFRVTHRFARPLTRGDFGEIAADLFGLDGGALIGLEFRIGLAPGLQAGLYRLSDRTLQLFAQQNVLRQRPGRAPLGLDVLVAVEGQDNFSEEHAPAIGMLLSRTVGRHAAIYLEPIWVGNTDFVDRFGYKPPGGGEAGFTVLVGLGTRVRLASTVYAVGEFIPRAGFTPGGHHATVGLEKRVGGHMFQINVSRSLAQGLTRLARGDDADGWFLGFNITRKFF